MQMPSLKQRDYWKLGLLALLNLPLFIARTPLAQPLKLEWLDSNEDLFFALWIGANLLVVWHWWRGRGEADKRRLAPKQRAVLVAVAVGIGCVVLLATEVMLRLSGLYLTYPEMNHGRYESIWSYRNEIPWLNVGEPNRAWQWERFGVSYEIKYNAEGLRDVDHPVAKSPGTYRVLIVGGSFTMGWGAAFEDSYPQVLKRLLASRPIEVLAAGMGASDPVFVFQLISRRMLKYEPDLVVLTVNDSDVPDLIVRGGMDRFDADGFIRPPRAPRVESLYRRSHLVRAVLLDVLDYNILLLPRRERKRRSAAAVRMVAETLEAIRDLGKAEGFSLLVINNPPGLMKLRKESGAALAPLAGLLAKAGIRYLDLQEHFQSAIPPGREQDYYWPVDLHYNARGYEIMASGVASALVELPGFPRPTNTLANQDGSSVSAENP